MKKLIFEGAGWSESESSGDVGNCRIRATFNNDKGQQVYLELIGTKTHKYMLPSLLHYQIAGHVSHLFYTADHDKGYSESLSKFERHNFEWKKKNIISFLNAIGCSYKDIEVRSDWCGFSPTGKHKDDFHLKIKRKATQ